MPTITDINSSSFWEQKSALFGLLNYSISSAEKRLAAITGGRDTISANSGYMVFDTLLNGTLVERMRVTSAGKVGIGTTNPAWTLDVTGDINASGSLRLNGAALSTAGNFWAAGSGGAIYYNGGNVGIGTASPQVLLHVAGPSNISFDASGIAGGSYQSAQVSVGGANPGANSTKRLYLGYDTTANYGVIQAAQAGAAFTPLLLNPNGGNVGIGTTSPQVLLDLPGYNIATSAVRIGSMEFDAIALSNSLFTDNIYYNGATFSYRNSGFGTAIQQNTGNIVFHTVPSGTGGATVPSLTERMRITNGGNVGIGTASPNEKLHVNGAVQITGTVAGSPIANMLSLDYSSSNARLVSYGPNATTFPGIQFGLVHSDGSGYFVPLTITSAGGFTMPNLPTVAPGAGSKQLWADPADSYRVKWAN